MIRLNFICTFKSDIVLHSSSNTEGKVEKFNYIAGSNFLGMVARAYNRFGDDAFDIFHSGKVRFLDAHILIDEQKTFHVPFSWFAPKGVSLKEAINEKELYNDHFITNEQYKEFANNEIQLKQQRNGFLTLDGNVANIQHTYTQKSAYDRKNRRSKKSAMFGYYALQKATKWSFCVELDDDKYKSNIIEILENSKRLGKSKSAEYGRVEIKYIDDEQNDFIPQELKTIEIDNKHYIFLYAYSRLALTDDMGNNSYHTSLTSLKLDEGEIDWKKSQIRTNRYTPYNTKRENRDFERLIIEKGSILAIEVQKEFDVKAYSEKIQKGIGLYLSEGHGKVVVNPSFLLSKEVSFQGKEQKTVNEHNSSLKKYGVINSWLEEQEEKKIKEYKLLKSVKEFIANHNVKNKKSQWGQIRSLCSAYITDEKIYETLFSGKMENNHKKGFLLHGMAEKKWDKQLIEDLMDEKNQRDDYHSFVKLLSIYAPKEDDKKGAEHE